MHAFFEQRRRSGAVDALDHALPARDCGVQQKIEAREIFHRMMHQKL